MEVDTAVRVRRLVTLTVGAALGAGAMYLLDPEHGEDRRRAARRRAMAQARTGAVRALDDARGRTREMAAAAMQGYRSSRHDGIEPHDRTARY